MCISHRLYRTQTTQNAVARPPVNTTMANMIVASSDVLRLEPLKLVCGIFALKLWYSPSSARPSIRDDIVKLLIEIEPILLNKKLK